MFDMEHAAKLMQMGMGMQMNTLTDVCKIHPDTWSEVYTYLQPVVQAFYYVFVAEPTATVYDIIRVILARIFVIYVIFRGTLMNEKRSDILIHGINYLFFSFIWPLFLVYFFFATLLPSPEYKIW